LECIGYFVPEVSFDDISKFEKPVFFNYTQFLNANFTSMKFTTVSFANAKFKGVADFSDIKFNDLADFSNIEFFGDSLFYLTEFRCRVIFDDVTFDSIANFNYTKFSEIGAREAPKPIKESANFPRVKFHKKATFDSAIFFGESKTSVTSISSSSSCASSTVYRWFFFQAYPA
jgi:uncharacterized protein YjbI with pentapeptide repeats